MSKNQCFEFFLISHTNPFHWFLFISFTWFYTAYRTSKWHAKRNLWAAFNILMLRMKFWFQKCC